MLALRRELRSYLLEIRGEVSSYLFAFGRESGPYIFKLGSEISSYLLTLSGQSSSYLFLLLVQLLLLVAPRSLLACLSLLLLLKLDLQGIDLVDELLLVSTVCRVVVLNGHRGGLDVLLELDALHLGLSEAVLSTLDVGHMVVNDIDLGIETLNGRLEALDLNLLLGHNHLGVVVLLRDNGLVLLRDESSGTGRTELDGIGLLG